MVFCEEAQSTSWTHASTFFDTRIYTCIHISCTYHIHYHIISYHIVSNHIEYHLATINQSIFLHMHLIPFLLGFASPFELPTHHVGHSLGASATPRTRGVCLWNVRVDLQQRRLVGAAGKTWWEYLYLVFCFLYVYPELPHLYLDYVCIL